MDYAIAVPTCANYAYICNSSKSVMNKPFILPYEGGLIEKDLPGGILHNYEMQIACLCRSVP